MAMTRAVLGIESSCDETAAAVVTEQGVVLGSEISSQIAIHHEYGGVVPELASRHHLLNMVPVLQTTLARAGTALGELHGIAVTQGPGLVGALLVGLQFAKSLAWVGGLPLVGVDHLLAHLEAPFLRSSQDRAAAGPPFPHVFLLVSGGHTVLGLRVGPERVRVLGATRDDAAGEAFDKVAKMLGLGYPGGPVIDGLAPQGNPEAFRLPRAMMRRAGTGRDFSFSGLKTAVRRILVERPELRTQPQPPAGGSGGGEGTALADLCASFQQAVVDVLRTRVEQAVVDTGVREVVVAGGVAANRQLRSELKRSAQREDYRLHLAAPRYCTDNAAMVAFAGHRRLARGEQDNFELNAMAGWEGRIA
jgi:N6-L-threonylcarbamoyladenine synthase